MIENILRTTENRGVKDCNVVYVSIKGNTELLAHGLSQIFNTVFSHQSEHYTWNDNYPKNNVLTLPTKFINMPIDYIIYDDLVMGYEEARKLGYFFQAPLLYLNLTHPEDIAPTFGYAAITIDDNDKKVLEERQEKCFGMHWDEPFLFGADVGEKQGDSTVVVLDNYCDDFVVKKIASFMPEGARLSTTDRQGSVVLEGADLFIHTWNYPTVKLISYLRAGTPVLFFPTHSNLTLLEDGKNGKAIQNLETINEEIKYVLDESNNKRISLLNKERFFNYNVENFKIVMNNKVYYSMEFFKG